jgi:LPXTG-motif cell wall-anchored protein
MENSIKLSIFASAKFVILAATLAISLVSLGLFIVSPARAAQPPVQLGTASSFAVLAGSGITNTGATTVSGSAGGDLGSSPTATFTGSVLVTTNGTKYTAADAAVDAAKNDLVIAYNDAAGRIPALTVAGNLGGQTLNPGVYNSASTLDLTGTLTLDAENDPNAVFVFQAGSTLTTASASSIQLINGAQACNVFWQVGSSATLGTNSVFAGHVMALTSITATTGATIQGQLLARNGAVTLDTNTIVNDLCVTVVAPPTTEPTTEPTVEPTPEATTDLGGELPDTEGINSWWLLFAAATALVVAGATLLGIRRKRG